MSRYRRLLLLSVIALCDLNAQSVAIRDLVVDEGGRTARLMGYGLVTGLPGTGDRVTGAYGSRQTVQSIVNLLRRFDIQVPPEVLRTRNVAAVLVTAEVSPYLRPGGRFDVEVASLGDASSLRGGVLWMTPLVSEAGGTPVAGAQGSLNLGTMGVSRVAMSTMTSGRVPDGGIIDVDLPRPPQANAGKLLLRDPDIGTAARIAAAVDSAFGKGSATVDDPGAITITAKDSGSSGPAGTLARIRELRVQPSRAARLVLDSRDGTIVAGADLRIGAAAVSHDGISVVIGDAPDSTGRGGVRAPAGSTVRDLANALHAAHATAAQTAAIFSALHEAGALVVEVVVR